MRKAILLAAALIPAATAIAAETANVPYPDGYRQWVHVKSMTINPGHALYDAFGGIHHLYANKKAMQGYKAGKFADGSVIVFDLLEAKAIDNTVQEGARKVLGVMHKDAKKFKDTGGLGIRGLQGRFDDRARRGQERCVGVFPVPRAAKEPGFRLLCVQKVGLAAPARSQCR